MLLWFSNGYALESDFHQAIHIDSNNADWNNQRGGALTGNITIQQGTIKLQAQKLVTELDAKDKGVSRIIVTGSPVKFEQQVEKNKWVRGTANQIIYDVKKFQIILSNQVHLTLNGMDVNANSIIYGLKNSDIEAKGSQNNRVKMVLQPTEFKEMQPLR